jgi:hypothetical protein
MFKITITLTQRSVHVSRSQTTQRQPRESLFFADDRRQIPLRKNGLSSPHLRIPFRKIAAPSSCLRIPLRKIVRLPPPLPKKPRQHLCCLRRHQPFLHHDSMVQQIRIRQSELASHRSKAQIPRRKNYPPDSRVDHRPGAHRARLKRHIHSRFRKTIVLASNGSLPQCHNFCMSRGVARANRLVKAFPNNRLAQYQNRAHRYFSLLAGMAS